MDVNVLIKDILIALVFCHGGVLNVEHSTMVLHAKTNSLLTNRSEVRTLDHVSCMASSQSTHQVFFPFSTVLKKKIAFI